MTKQTKPELLSPAGSLECALAAFHFGADAVYLGVERFSARADAVNFTKSELQQIVAYAHDILSPPRRVYVAINTLALESELASLLDTVEMVAELGVDAVIVQDLAAVRLVRQHFPRLPLHASTQMAVHSRAGADTLRQWGFKRIIAARELTAEEIGEISSLPGLEVEVFVHGALCYSYSGLCLLSSHLSGRSGNRGVCGYPCRRFFKDQGSVLSMKDLALSDVLRPLCLAGVAAMKIEGRKKSPLYVAAVTNLYRQLLDGNLNRSEQQQLEADIQTIFSRPWTTFHVRGMHSDAMIDAETVGHRGTAIGVVEQFWRAAAGRADQIQFRTSRALGVHDGLQIDLPGFERPYGFGVAELWILQADGRAAGADRFPHEGWQRVFAVPAGAVVRVSLPVDHPRIPLEAPVYHAMSGELKQRYAFPRPRLPKDCARDPLAVEVTIAADRVSVRAHVRSEFLPGINCEAAVSENVACAAARQPGSAVDALREAFSRLGGTPFRLASLQVHNPDERFIPVSLGNSLRRQVTAVLEQRLAELRAQSLQRIAEQTQVHSFNLDGWIIKVDRAEYLTARAGQDISGVQEIIIDLTSASTEEVFAMAGQAAALVGAAGVRFGLPIITRAWEEADLLATINALRAAGWTKWETANWSGWCWLHAAGCEGGLEISSDWPLYVLNHLAAAELVERGIRRITLSPEDGQANLALLLPALPVPAAVIVYQDTPLCISETSLNPAAGGRHDLEKDTGTQETRLISQRGGENLLAVSAAGRTVILSNRPFCVWPEAAKLPRGAGLLARADFVRRRYEPAEVAAAWASLRQGQPIPHTHSGNWSRGLPTRIFAESSELKQTGDQDSEES
jgi:putative protease